MKYNSKLQYDKCEIVFAYATNLCRYKRTVDSQPTTVSTILPQATIKTTLNSSSKRTSISTPSEKETKKALIIYKLDTLESLPTDVKQIYTDNWNAMY